MIMGLRPKPRWGAGRSLESEALNNYARQRIVYGHPDMIIKLSRPHKGSGIILYKYIRI